MAVTLTSANQEYYFDIPEGARELVFRLSDRTKVSRWSFNSGEVADSSGASMPLLAGEYFEIDGPIHATRLYFASVTAGDRMILTYLHRHRIPDDM